MNERLKEIVKQARLPACHLSHPVALERFAELVSQDEREACAKLCDDLAMVVGNNNFIAVDQRKFCAKQIRARGNHAEN